MTPRPRHHYQPDQPPFPHTCSTCARPGFVPVTAIALAVPIEGEPYALIPCEHCAAMTTKYVTPEEVTYYVAAGVQPPEARRPAASAGPDFPLEILEWRHGPRLRAALSEEELDALVDDFAWRMATITDLDRHARRGLHPSFLSQIGR